MSDVIETDYTTDPPTITERDFTIEELEQREADRVAYEKAEKERAYAEAARIAARESAMLKLAALGLNESEVAAIVGGV